MNYIIDNLNNALQDRRAGREHGRSQPDGLRDRFLEKRMIESGDSSGYESGAQNNRTLWKKPEEVEEEQ